MIKILAASRLKIAAGRETGIGAGMLLYCTETGRFLLMKRSSKCDDPKTWCGLGGGVEEGEELHEAVRREAYEEAGFDEELPCDLHYLGCQRSEDFEFHNYLGLIDHEPEIVRNEEHTDHMWTTWDQRPDNMHPKMMQAFETPDGQELLHRHTNALD